ELADLLTQHVEGLGLQPPLGVAAVVLGRLLGQPLEHELAQRLPVGRPRAGGLAATRLPPCHVVQCTAKTTRTMYDSLVQPTTNSIVAVRTTGLGKRYGDFWALRDLDLDV